MAGCTLWLFGPRLHAGVFRFAGGYEPAPQPPRQRLHPDSDRPCRGSGTQVTILGVSPSIPIIGRCPPAHHGLKPVVAPCPKSADERYEIAWNQQISPGCLLG